MTVTNGALDGQGAVFILGFYPALPRLFRGFIRRLGPALLRDADRVYGMRSCPSPKRGAAFSPAPLLSARPCELLLTGNPLLL
jgi:hypothetical protein